MIIIKCLVSLIYNLGIMPATFYLQMSGPLHGRIVVNSVQKEVYVPRLGALSGMRLYSFGKMKEFTTFCYLL